METINYPPVALSARLLFIHEPAPDAGAILQRMKEKIKQVTHLGGTDEALFFAFPDFQTEIKDGKVPASCILTKTTSQHPEKEVPQAALQQNWHWQEGDEQLKACRYELLATDFMSWPLPYSTRVDLFMNFLVAATEVLKPDVIYSVPGEKLIDPATLPDIWRSKEQPLYAICNVRLYNISDSTNNALLMDTVGLYALGLPDFQINFTGKEASDIAKLLWDMAYYIYEKGDVIKDGNTIAGLSAGSMWKCNKQPALLEPAREVINIEPD